MWGDRRVTGSCGRMAVWQGCGVIAEWCGSRMIIGVGRWYVGVVGWFVGVIGWYVGVVGWYVGVVGWFGIQDGVMAWRERGKPRPLRHGCY